MPIPNQPPSHSRHALVGQFALVGTVEIAFKPSVSVEATCTAQLPPIRIAAFGAVSLLVMPALRLGIGLNLHAALEAADGTVGLTGKVGFQSEIGWDCAAGFCQGLKTLTEIDEVKPTLKAPDTHGIHVDLSAQLYAFAGLDLAVLGGLAGYFGIAEAKIGPKQSAVLASEDDQAQLPDSSSSYRLDLVGSIAPGSGLKAALKQVLGDDVTVDLNFQKGGPLSQSPKGTMTVSKPEVGVGDTAKFTVDIDPSTASYLGIGYNIVSIEFYRRKLGEDAFTRFEDLEIFTSASNQTHFEKEWKTTSQEIGKWEFAAFVHTEVHDIGLLPLLEIADDSRKQLEVAPICAAAVLGRQAAARGGNTTAPPPDQCQVTGSIHHTQVVDSPGMTHIEFNTDATVQFTQYVSSPVLLVFRADGTCNMRFSGTAAGCSENATSTSCTFDPDGSLEGPHRRKQRSTHLSLRHGDQRLRRSRPHRGLPDRHHHQLDVRLRAGADRPTR